MTPLLLILALPLAAPAGCEPPLQAALDRLDQTIVRLEKELPDVSQRALKQRLQRRLADARAAARHVRSEACAPDPESAAESPAASDPTRAEPLATRTPLEAPLFRALLSGLRGEHDPEDQLSLLEARLSGECVSVAQAKQVLAELRRDPDKLLAARRLVPRLTDRARAFELTKAVGPAREGRMRSLIKSAQPVPGCGG